MADTAKSALERALERLRTGDRCSTFDAFIGTCDELAAVGLVQPEQLPGAPGMRKLHVTILPDGTIPSRAPQAVLRDRRAPGAKRVSRASRGKFRVQVYVPNDEAARRQQIDREDLERPWRVDVGAVTEFVAELDDQARLRFKTLLLGPDAPLTRRPPVARQLTPRPLPAGWRVIAGGTDHG